VVVAVQRWATEEVGQHVVHSRAVLRTDGQIVAQGKSVQLAEQAGKHLAACSLPVDDVHVRAVVHVEQQRLAVQQRAVGRSAGHYGQ
jgi:transketolase